MTQATRLAVEIDTFARIIDELQAIASRSDPGRRSELVRLRKRLSEHIVAMRDIGVQTFTDAGDVALTNEFRSRLSTMLNLVAMHQANWPAVSIDENDIAYRQSSNAVALTNRNFIDWTRGVLARIG